MITRARIYKKKGQWRTDVWGEPALLSIMTDNTVRLKDGTTVGRWFWDTWQQAREFVVGPEWRGGRGMIALRQRAWVLRYRRELLSAVCMIPGCGCNGDPHP